MARKGYGRHKKIVTGISNDPDKQVSVDAWNDDLDAKGMFGLEPTTSSIVISSGNLTPTDTWTVAESETSPSADDLANILTTETSTEDILFVVGKSGDTITLKHQATGAGQIHLLGQADKVLNANVPTLLIRRGTDWYEFGGGSFTSSSTDTLTNKTINLTNNTLTGTTAEFNTALSDGSFTTLAGSETLTNKTLTTPIISSISNTGTLTLPTSTDTLVGRATTDTLTNKTLGATTIAGHLIPDTDVAYDLGSTSFKFRQTFTKAIDLVEYMDIKAMSVPADPSTDTGRMYFKTIDASNEGLFIKLKQSGSIVEVQIA
jgi:hypothetical protein